MTSRFITALKNRFEHFLWPPRDKPHRENHEPEREDERTERAGAEHSLLEYGQHHWRFAPGPWY